MKIFIPTSGRAENQTTLEHLPESIAQKVVLVVPPEELVEYSINHSWVKISAPDIPMGIGPARQWCCEFSSTDNKVLMLDDDLVFATRRDDDPTKFRDATEDEIVDLFNSIEANLNKFASVGVSTREGGNRDTSNRAYDTRLLRVLAYRTDILRDHDIRFDDIPVMEDFYVSLSLLTKGYRNVKLNHMVHNQNGSGMVGGCSQYRTMDVQALAAMTLQAKFPSFVTVVQKETKTAWGGGVRTDVRIGWKKALKSAKEMQHVGGR